MSEQRRRYVEQSARQAQFRTSPAEEEEDDDTAFQRWVAEQQRERLQAELQRVGTRDPHIAAALQEELDTLDAAMPVALAPAKPYDPSRLYSRMAAYYHWTYDSMDEMDYDRFFSAAREMFIAKQEEIDATRQPRQGQTVEASAGDEWHLLAHASPAAEAWPGEVLDR